MANTEKVVYTVAEIQSMLGISKSAAYTFVHSCYENKEPFIVILVNRKYLIVKESFDNYLAGV